MSWLTPRRLVAAALAAWLAVAVLGVVLGPPLGHDEAAFAIAARGDQRAGTWLHRSDGTVGLARLGLALGGADWQFRLPCAVLGAAIVVATFAVGRAASSARTGAWAAALVAGAHPMALRSAQLLSDLPASAALLGGIAVLVGELERAGPSSGVRWRIVAAAPLFAAAFYLRYASAPVVAIALAAAGPMWWRTVAARPLPVLAVPVVLAGLLVPHLVHAVRATGSLIGIVMFSAGVPRRAYFGDGLITYLTSNPLDFYGALIAPVMLAGVIGLVQTRRRAPWYLAVVAIGQLVVLGLHNHGQPRYVFVATVLLVVVGVEAASRIGRPGLALAAVAAAWLGTAVTQVVLCRGMAQLRAPIVRAADAIRADAAGRRCAAVAATVPQLEWYAGCEVYKSQQLAAPMPADRVRYAVVVPNGEIDLPSALAMQHLGATPVASEAGALVWRLE